MCGMARGRCQTHSHLANCTLVDCFHLLYVYLTSSVRVSFYQMVSFTQLKWISGRWVACTDKLLVSLPKQFPAISWSTSFSLKEARLMPSLPIPLYLVYVFSVVTSSIWLRKKKIVVPNIFFCKLWVGCYLSHKNCTFSLLFGFAKVFGCHHPADLTFLSTLPIYKPSGMVDSRWTNFLSFHVT